MKRFIKIAVFVVIICLCATSFISCGSASRDGNTGIPPISYNPSPHCESDSGSNLTEFNEIYENNFVDTTDDNSSTFSVNVNTAAYPYLRNTINNNSTIQKNQIKTEELVNYFKYDYPQPDEGEILSVNTSIFDCPWSDGKLLTVGLKAEDIEETETRVRNNFVFLIDVSGSMGSSEKLELLKSAFNLILNDITEDDTISIVTYSNTDTIVLNGENGGEKETIRSAINDLRAGGATDGSNGIKKAYNIAQENYIEGGNNRVILATDGDFNIGITTQSGLEAFIAQKRTTGIYLSALGFGDDNLKDNKMESLANNGNGIYCYVDSVHEVEHILETMAITLARDVKAKVVFNPAKVRDYRLIGYENLLLSEEEYEDNATDAGEIGSGFTVTAVYEIHLEDTDEESILEDNFLQVQIKYKSPDVDDNTEHEISVFADESNIIEEPNEDMLFISAVVETCLVLRNSHYKGTASIANAYQRLSSLTNISEDIKKVEFAHLVAQYMDRYQ